MLTCKEVTYLASKKLEKKLTLKERVNFFTHILMCRLCRGYNRDIAALHKVVRKKGKTERIFLPDSSNLSEQSRKRIKQALDKEMYSKNKSNIRNS